MCVSSESAHEVGCLVELFLSLWEDESVSLKDDQWHLKSVFLMWKLAVPVHSPQ